MKARDVRQGDRIDGKMVRWVMQPMRAGVHPLLPHGGALITFTDDTQVGYLLGEEVAGMTTNEETLGMAAALLRDRAHTLRVRAVSTNVRERTALRERAAKLERAGKEWLTWKRSAIRLRAWCTSTPQPAVTGTRMASATGEPQETPSTPGTLCSPTGRPLSGSPRPKRNTSASSWRFFRPSYG